LVTLIIVWKIVKAVLGISFVIFWHELGHFLLAKWNGVYVKTFSIGFPPRLVTLFKHKETEYVLGSVPLGGYVHMLGEDEGQTEPGPNHPGVPDAEGQPRADVEPSLANHPGAFFNKSVWARMAIISAGVVMNVILGVALFVAVYAVGGRLEAPAVIGGVGAGGPAYQAGLQAGDEVLAIDGEKNVTFEDLNRIVVHSGPEQVLTFTVNRPGLADPIDVPVRPERDPIEQVPKIRVALPQSLTLFEAEPFLRPPGMEDTPEGEFKGGDRILQVGIQGEDAVPVGSPRELDRLLDQHRDRPLTFVVSRTASDEGQEADGPDEMPPVGSNIIDRPRITVPPAHFVDFGIRLNPGPVVALRKDSPAAEAGLEPGDLIVAVDGNPDYDPMRLPALAADRVGSPIMLTVLRDGEEVSLSITPTEGESWSRALSPDAPLNVDTIGMAMKVEPKVVAVREGSPADQAGLKPGDEITGLNLTLPKTGEEEDGEPQVTETTIDETHSWVQAFDFIQNYPFDSITLTVAGRDKPLPIRPEPVADWFYPERGLQLDVDVVPIPPMPLADAFNRAGSETLEVMGSFYTLLQRLFEGQVGTKGLSGPIRIAKAMYDFAGVNLVEFLWFLGFISINLAVVNFLPIPPLDGGRMVFLIGEAVRGRPLPESWQALPTYVGLFFLLGLMAFVLIQDTILTFF
jgi:regulator of sigma E protease